MRMRPKKNRETRMERVKDLFAIKKGETLDIEKTFGEGKILLEIGCGKGSFICGLSEKYPKSNLVAVELVPDVLMMAMEKSSAMGCVNVRFMNENAENVDVFIPEGSVSALYLNFSDPWPKNRNAKRRLTSPVFLEKYKKILAEDGKIFFKTDNKGLFDYSLKTFAAAGYTLESVCFDLHADSVLSVGNIETEYERNFSAKGFLINYLIAIPPKELQ